MLLLLLFDDADYKRDGDIVRYQDQSGMNDMKAHYQRMDLIYELQKPKGNVQL